MTARWKATHWPILTLTLVSWVGSIDDFATIATASSSTTTTDLHLFHEVAWVRIRISIKEFKLFDLVELLLLEIFHSRRRVELHYSQKKTKWDLCCIFTYIDQDKAG